MFSFSADIVLTFKHGRMEIEWQRGKCLTQTILEKMPRKRPLNDGPLTNSVRRKSFFNFFNTPHVRKMEDHDDHHDDHSVNSNVPVGL